MRGNTQRNAWLPPLFPREPDSTILSMKRRRIRSAWSYFLLTGALSLPFWLLGALSGMQLLPALPISALAAVCPVGAAAILCYRENAARGIRDLLRRSFDFDRIESKAWLLPTLLLMPLVSLVAYGVLRLRGTTLPAPQIPVARAVGLLLVFFVGGLCEELGWSGYAVDPLQDRFGALNAALIIGAVWAAWHFVPLAEAHRSFCFVAWWTVDALAKRVIIVWLYIGAGRSVFAAALVHALSNLAWQLFPVNGSFYDPQVTGIILALLALLVVAVSGPAAFARKAR